MTGILKSIYSGWASTGLGLGVNILVFFVSFFTSGTLTILLLLYGYLMLAIFGWGLYQQWDEEANQ